MMVEMWLPWINEHVEKQLWFEINLDTFSCSLFSRFSIQHFLLICHWYMIDHIGGTYRHFFLDYLPKDDKSHSLQGSMFCSVGMTMSHIHREMPKMLFMFPWLTLIFKYLSCFYNSVVRLKSELCPLFLLY